MLDLTAAFETIDHAILLSRLFHRFRVTGAALEWFRSNLFGRHQVVRIGNEKSPQNSVTFGVPHGSVLGPLLFTAYITPVGDIIKKFSLNYNLYADDTQLYVSFAPGGNSQLNTMDGIAGRDWLSQFMKRHPALSIRAPIATSLARINGFNRHAIEH